MVDIPQFKVVVVGAGGTGKTSWVSHLLKKGFEPKYYPTLGVEVHPLVFNVPRGPIQFNVWDCAGQERLAGLDDGYYINAHAAFVFVDDGNEWEKFVSKLERFDDTPIFYIRNKSDIVRPAASRLPHAFADISVKTGSNCNAPFEELARYFGLLEEGEHFVATNFEPPEEVVDLDVIREYEEELAHAAAAPLDDE